MRDEWKFNRQSENIHFILIMQLEMTRKATNKSNIFKCITIPER